MEFYLLFDPSIFSVTRVFNHWTLPLYPPAIRITLLKTPISPLVTRITLQRHRFIHFCDTDVPFEVADSSLWILVLEYGCSYYLIPSYLFPSSCFCLFFVAAQYLLATGGVLDSSLYKFRCALRHVTLRFHWRHSFDGVLPLAVQTVFSSQLEASL